MLDHFHKITTDEVNCKECGPHLYEVEVNGSYKRVTAFIFRSWSGNRKLDGEAYVGPVYYLGTNIVCNSHGKVMEYKA